MPFIKKLRLINFKRFQDTEINFDEKINTIIGDNESGKSTILQAINIICSASKSIVETIGIENLLNKQSVMDFLSSDRTIEKLPILHAEIYLSDETNPDIYGKNNCKKDNTSGIKLICEPDIDLSVEIKEVLDSGDKTFPYEFYKTTFHTFAGINYSGYKKFHKSLIIDSSEINSEYANKEYIKNVYSASTEIKNRILLKNQYRNHKDIFRDENLKLINDSLGKYKFDIKSGSKYNLETDITLTLDNIPIEERGKGQQCIIKTEFALSKMAELKSINTLLLEEPENHLSHVNMRKLISKIASSHDNKIIIATHSSLISSRLDLRKTILINSNKDIIAKLSQLSNSTANFFIKSPDNYILEFILSKKVILVEGDAEYLLIEKLYESIFGNTLADDDINVIAVGGLKFKRYMEIANLLSIKTAVIRDNDKNYTHNCIDNYAAFLSDAVSVYADLDNTRYTFEVCMYKDNTALCDTLFSGLKASKTVQDYMLSNKTECALSILDSSNAINVPAYIRKAFEWIRK